MRQIALALASALVLAPAAALAASLGVPINQSTLVALPSPAHNVIVGNPTIADVSVQDQRHIIITGKGAGVTNLVVTDAGGRPIFDRQIVVGGSSADRVSLITGNGVTRYACAPSCEPEGDGTSGGNPPASQFGMLASGGAARGATAPSSPTNEYGHASGVTASPGMP